MDWVIKEFATLSFKDKRLKNRAENVLEKLSRNAMDSIPAWCGGAAETKATYGFFDNDKVSPEKIHKAHVEATLARMAGHTVILIPQDTTVLNFSGQQQRKDTGPTTKDSTRGMHLDCAIALTPEKVCLGTVSVKQWQRKELQKLDKKERRNKNYTTLIEDKESYRWLESYKKANEYAAA